MRSAFGAAAFLMVAACGQVGEAETGGSAPAEDVTWRLVADESRLSFVSIKAGEVAETHTFESLSGSVTPGGQASVTIDLASVETNVEIRNERMQSMLFEVARFPDASVTASVPLEELSGLSVGERIRRSVPITVGLHGMNADYDADIYVTRIAEARVLVETASPVLVDASEFDLLEGIERLREVAGLPSITPAVPVTVSFVFSGA